MRFVTLITIFSNSPDSDLQTTVDQVIAAAAAVSGPVQPNGGEISPIFDSTQNLVSALCKIGLKAAVLKALDPGQLSTERVPHQEDAHTLLTLSGNAASQNGSSSTYKLNKKVRFYNYFPISSITTAWRAGLARSENAPVFQRSRACTCIKFGSDSFFTFH